MQGAQKPDKQISSNCLSSCTIHLRLNLALCYGKSRRSKQADEDDRQDKQHEKFSMLFHGIGLLYKDNGLEINAPTILTNSRRHHAFIRRRKTCPPNILHHDLKMLEVVWEDPIAKATGAV